MIRTISLLLAIIYPAQSSLTRSLKIQNGATFLESEISQLETTSIPESIAKARVTKAQTTQQSNMLAVSYGLTIVGANVAYTASQIWDKNITDFQYPDWGTVLANAGYAWGYGAPFLLAGQLDSPDPGCGLEEYYSTLETSPHLLPSLQETELGFSTAILRQAVLERDLNLRTGLACLQGQRHVFSLLDKLRSASLLRLELAQTLMDSLRS